MAVLVFVYMYIRVYIFKEVFLYLIKCAITKIILCNSTCDRQFCTVLFQLRYTKATVTFNILSNKYSNRSWIYSWLIKHICLPKLHGILIHDKTGNAKANQQTSMPISKSLRPIWLQIQNAKNVKIWFIVFYSSC